ncbi:diguanylate cyclase domain-containing protein [Hwanghaeella sp.]|uniref:diguanylate cyclase domain-containing protein n=1 Tax=Hwanghaeella sp. TaxID=2605943 RepID=UPI003CCBF891
MARTAHILLAERNEETATERQAALEKEGYDVRVSTDQDQVVEEVRAQQPDIVLLGRFKGEASLELLEALKADAATSSIPVILIGMRSDEAMRKRAVELRAADILESNRSSNDMILTRLQSVRRLAAMRSELFRRAETCAEFGVQADLSNVGVYDHAETAHLLMVSEASEYNADLYDALLGQGLDAIIEQAPYRAANRLDDNDFDAVVITATLYDDREKVLYLSSHIRNNTRLFNMPMLVVKDEDTDPPEMTLYRGGANIVLPHDKDYSALTTYTLLMVDRRRLWNSVVAPYRTIMTDKILDPDLGSVLSTTFFDAHLKREVKHALNRDAHLSVAVVSIPTAVRIEKDYGRENAELLLSRIANWLSGMVKASDAVGRLGTYQFGIIMPATPEKEANQVAFRIAGILQNSEFALGEEVMEAIHVLVDCGVATIQPYDTPKKLLTRARQAIG